ncbi:hypothetical protein RIF29_05805 [Crotalaria pallida]|uniref:Uncharacterized protein n=1 Tax=Crotalaria pallida TaxID=3830 RepID=A0AAN9J2G4_CROPI
MKKSVDEKGMMMMMHLKLKRTKDQKTSQNAVTVTYLLAKANQLLYRSFFPPGLVGDDIAEIIKARYSGAWPTWSHVPKATRKEWLELFELKYKWLPIYNEWMENAFAHKGSLLIKNTMSKIRDGKNKGKWLLPSVLESLRQYWDTDVDFQKRSANGKQNRATDVGAPLYTGGRVSTADHVYRMEKINMKRPTCMDVLGRTKKKDGRWVGKAEEVAVTNPYH